MNFNFNHTRLISNLLACSPLLVTTSCNRGEQITGKEPGLPNIILITVDDMGWRDLGCYGSTYYETPAVDSLATRGVKFTDAYASAAICSPTRASLMTGKYPARVGITDWIRAGFQGGGDVNPVGFEGDSALKTPVTPHHLPLEEVTLAEILKSAGYTTAHIGKWHLGTENFFPDRQGFDVNIGGCDYGEPPSFFDPYVRYPNQWYTDTLYGFPTMDSRMEGEYLTDREAKEAINFINENKDKPFFLNLSHYAVHTPIDAKPELITKYKEKIDSSNQKSAVYAAMVESVDHALRDIRAILDKLNLSGNTIIIFTSDNGGLVIGDRYTHNYPLRDSKGSPYEGGIRVPLIIYHPSYKEGKVSNEPVTTPDLFPTVLDFAGIAVPDSLIIDGLSLVPLVKDEGAVEREAIYWHFPHYRYKGIYPYSIVRKGDFKLIKKLDRDTTLELYNLSEDISETTDLSKKLPGKTKELEKQLDQWLVEIDAQMPVKNPEYTGYNHEK